MEVDEVSDMVADMEVAKVADMVADMMADVEVNKVSDVMLQFGEGVGHMGWLSGPNFFDLKLAHLVSQKLCEFIFIFSNISYIRHFVLIFVSNS